MATVSDLVRRFFPDASDYDVNFYLWETTCYPYGSTLQVARHLKRTKKAIDEKLSVCYRCGELYENNNIVDFYSQCGGCCEKDRQHEP